MNTNFAQKAHILNRRVLNYFERLGPEKYTGDGTVLDSNRLTDFKDTVNMQKNTEK